MHSDLMKKYGISVSMIQALYYDIQSHNKGLYYGSRDDILSHMVTMHQEYNNTVHTPGIIIICEHINFCGVSVIEILIFNRKKNKQMKNTANL